MQEILSQRTEFSRSDRTWAEVDLDSIAHNVRKIKEKTTGETRIMGVVKADAYGHGAAEIIPTLIENGVTWLAVAMLDEAVELRRCGITLPILILNHTDPCRTDEILRYDLAQTVFSLEMASALSQSAVEAGKEARIHIKIDTGMGRLGFAPDDGAMEAIQAIQAMPGIQIEGIFTHFATADGEDPAYTFLQFERFMAFCHSLERRRIKIPLRHVCNSAATLRFPEMHLDMVRVGILLYGMSPSSFCNAIRNGFKPAMTFKTRIVHLKVMDPGQSVSYGRTFTAQRKSLIATFPVGYADGYSRTLSNKGVVLIRGKRYPVAGTVCMDSCMADVTGSVVNDNMTVFTNDEKGFLEECVSPPVQIGDEAVLFGRQGEAFLDIDEIAVLRNTINYEVTCNIGRRVPRVYFKNGNPVGTKNYLVEKNPRENLGNL